MATAFNDLVYSKTSRVCRLFSSGCTFFICKELYLVMALNGFVFLCHLRGTKPSGSISWKPLGK